VVNTYWLMLSVLHTNHTHVWDLFFLLYWSILLVNSSIANLAIIILYLLCNFWLFAAFKNIKEAKIIVLV